jgi:hypothetical protein
MNSGAPEGKAVPAQQVAPVVYNINNNNNNNKYCRYFVSEHEQICGVIVVASLFVVLLC